MHGGRDNCSIHDEKSQSCRALECLSLKTRYIINKSQINQPDGKDNNIK